MPKPKWSLNTIYISERLQEHNVYGNEGSGSGFFIDDKGTLVTNYHVVEFADKISIAFNNGAKYDVKYVVDFEEKFDLAVLKVDIKGNDYFNLTDTYTKGEQVYAIGSALGDFLVNTGCYLIEPEVLKMIPEGTFIHMPDVIQMCMDAGESVGVYPISEEQWQDMGQIDEMEKMQKKLKE